ncbi:MAG: polysaccharide biosynthesis protein [Mangrovicoccus sp.]
MQMAADVLLVPLCLYGSMFLWAGQIELRPDLWANWAMAPFLMVLAVLLSLILGLSSFRLNGFETVGLPMTTLFASTLTIAAVALNKLASGPAPWHSFISFGLLLFLGVIGSRIWMRYVLVSILRQRTPRTAVIIYGAGRAGMQLATALRHDYENVPVAFIDDNPALRRLTVAGLPVMAPVDMERTIFEKGVTKVLLAMPSLSPSKRARILKQLEPFDVDVQTLPSFAQLIGDARLADKLTPVKPSEFLQRSPYVDDLRQAQETFFGANVLVSGAGGTIGSELCRQLLAIKPRKIVLLEHSELALYTVELELRGLSEGVKIVPVLGSVTDEVLCRKVLESHDVEIIFHAAAYKHVPMVETNPLVGLSNNVLGTRVLAEAARDVGVERFVLVSTDKAVRPANVMGASKRMAELVIQDMASRPGPLFSIVRFGNVLGSSGSVIPLFQEQILNGGPVTLTHNDVTRYFMTVGEAARLLLTSAALTKGGEVFVLDMGEPVLIRDLAYQMIKASGYSVKDAKNPSGDIEIRVTGLRPGEKLHEELLIGTGHTTTSHPKITQAREQNLSELEIANALRALRDAISEMDEEAARAVLRRWVEPQRPVLTKNLA